MIINRNVPGLSLLLLIALLAGCLKEPESPQPPATVDSIDQLVAPEGFQFETHYVQPITLLAQNAMGEPMKRIQFLLYTAPPEKGGVLLAKGLTNAEGEFRTEITASTSQQALYVYTPYRDLVTAQRLELTGGTPIHHSWGSLPDANTEEVYKTIPQDGSFTCNSTFFQVVGATLKELDVLSGTYMTVGTASGNYNGIGFSPEDNFIYGFQGTNLWKIDNTGQETNLGAINGMGNGFNYRADFDTLGNLVAISYQSGNYRLGVVDVDAQPLSATEYPLSPIGTVSGNIHDMVYSPYFRHYYAMTTEAHLLRIDYENFTIEDIGDFSGSGMETGSAYGAGWTSSDSNLYWSYNSSGKIYQVEMDDSGSPIAASYVLTGDITNNNDGCSCAEADSPFEDADNDGVPNGVDDFPEDSEVAFATFTPSEYGYGTYAFEDMWPRKGDYDFNDAVLRYHYTLAQDTNNLAHKLFINIQLEALGAGFQNGFGIQLEGLSPADIQSVSGTAAPSITTTSGGCESGQSKAVLIVYDNGHTLMGARNGQFINTSDTAGVILDPVELQVEVVFTTPQASIGEINPFIFTKGIRGNEIHLKGFAPTDLVDNNLFGTFSDASEGTNTYQTANGMPWGLSFSTEFSYPKEKANFLDAYPFFSNWVLSGGSEQTNWYLSSKATPAYLFQ